MEGVTLLEGERVGLLVGVTLMKLEREVDGLLEGERVGLLVGVTLIEEV